MAPKAKASAQSKARAKAENAKSKKQREKAKQDAISKTLRTARNHISNLSNRLSNLELPKNPQPNSLSKRLCDCTDGKTNDRSGSGSMNVRQVF